MDELSTEELIDLAYWRKSIHACTGDGLKSYEPDEIKYLKLHQQWYVNARVIHQKKVRKWPLSGWIRSKKKLKCLPAHGKWNGAKILITNNRLFTSITSQYVGLWAMAPRPTTQLHWHPSGKMHFGITPRWILSIRQTIKPSTSGEGDAAYFQNWSVILLPQSTTI